MKLRDYQQRTVDSLWQWFYDNEEGNPLLVLPTGAGKSIVIAEICRHALTEWPGTRILMTVKSRELCEQNAEKLANIWPDAPLGIHSASVGRKDIGHDILYTTIGSVYKKAALLGRINLIIIDEAHLCSPKEQGMYRQLIADLKLINPYVRVIGTTATPFDGKGIWLTDHVESIFTAIASNVTMTELLDQGYLSELVPAKTSLHMSSDGVKMQGGDFIVSELAKKIDKPELIQAACRELVELGKDRKKWIVFGVTIDHATHIKECLCHFGISAEVVSADTPKAIRQRIIDDFRSGTFRALVNVTALGTGLDVPEIDLVALMRNTRSPVLYLQLLGRAMRIADGKENALVCDFTDTVETLGPVDTITGKANSGKGTGEAPFKVCPQCGNRNATATSECKCGYKFPPPERIKHGMQASDAAILSSQIKPKIEEIPVNDVTYKIQSSKKDGTPMLKVTYHCGIVEQYDEFVCLEHEGYAKSKAYQWWRRRSDSPVPSTAADAMIEALDLPKPATITVSKMSKYPEILSHNF